MAADNSTMIPYDHSDDQMSSSSSEYRRDWFLRREFMEEYEAAVREINMHAAISMGRLDG